MLATLPKTSEETKGWEWAQIEPFFTELLSRELNENNVEEWLRDWTQLSDVVMGRYSKLEVDVTCDTANKELEEELNKFTENIVPSFRKATHNLMQKMLESGLTPRGMEIPLKKLRNAAEIFREANLPLFVEETLLSNEYDKIIGAQSVVFNGKEQTISQLKLNQQNPDREVREKAWRAGSERQLQDREALNQLWVKFLTLRQKVTANTGLASYIEYKWKQLNRFDYTPQDCESFHAAIEQAVVPAAKRIYERRRKKLGLDSVRPWDLEVEPQGVTPLKPFKDGTELESKAENIFRKVDPELGEYFAIMRREGLLDLENRMNKGPGGYSTGLFINGVRRPFIFMNAVGLQQDVVTMLHEAGHAFHAFEVAKLPYSQQRVIGSEFNEVASMAMELLGAPYLSQSEGGYYTEAEAARARIEHLEGIILFWPYMAVVDAFQLWVYRNVEAALNPAECDRKWGELWDRFMPGQDWSGLEDAKVTGWHRKLHIFQLPFYYVEYGIAQLGAVQIWANALKDQAKAVASYRAAHRLGGTASLPDLYATAGARFAFDTNIIQTAVDLIERTITELEGK